MLLSFEQNQSVSLDHITAPICELLCLICSLAYMKVFCCWFSSNIVCCLYVFSELCTLLISQHFYTGFRSQFPLHAHAFTFDQKVMFSTSSNLQLFFNNILGLCFFNGQIAKQKHLDASTHKNHHHNTSEEVVWPAVRFSQCIQCWENSLELGPSLWNMHDLFYTKPTTSLGVRCFTVLHMYQLIFVGSQFQVHTSR